MFAVGNDWDNATARVLGSGQTMVHQFLDTATGNTYWVQAQSVLSNSPGTLVALNDIAPTTDRWNLAAVEILPVSNTPPDTTPPSVQISSPAAGSTVSATVVVSATASDDGTVASVQFFADNNTLGRLTSPPFTVSWDTTTVSDGAHSLTATAVDGAGNSATSAPVSVTVNNSAPPNVIGMDAAVSADGQGTITTQPFSTLNPGDLLLAFIAYDGPPGSAQTASISGAALTWALVKRSNFQHGTSEVWSARAHGALSGATVTSQPQAGASFHGSMTVIAFTNAAGTGEAAQTSAPSGPPDCSISHVSPGYWVFAVGNDWDQAIARTAANGEVLVHQAIDVQVGDTFWVQSTAAPSNSNLAVDISDTGPTADQWNYACVAIVPTHP
jgi:hypothetical protein